MNSYIAGNYKTLSNTISQVVPAVILENTNFEDLFLAYYKFTEQSGQFYKESKILFDSFNYSNADEKYLKIFKEQLLRMFPDNGQIALEYFLKFSKVFYKSKGSEESYKFLFKVLYDSDVEITYPSDYILKSSDGEWVKRNLVKIENFFDVNENGIIDFQELIVGKTLNGITTNTTAFISDIVSYDANMLELHIEMINGNFEIDEVVHIIYPDSKYSVSRILPSIGSYKIIDGGIGYLANKALQFKTKGDGFNFSVSIDSVNPINGQILSLDIKNSGYNYLYQMPVLDLTDFLLFDNDNYTDYIPKYGPKEFYFGYNNFKTEYVYNSAAYDNAIYSYSNGNEIILDKNTNSFVYGSTKIGYGSYNGLLDTHSLYYGSNNLYGPKSFYNISNSTTISGYQYGIPEYGNAKILANKIINNINEHNMRSKINFSISIGIAGYEANDLNIDDIILRADNSLYEAKKAGKNRAI
jgi:Ca2+-binding EF-hand superfamily protein